MFNWTPPCNCKAAICSSGDLMEHRINPNAETCPSLLG